MLVSKENPIGEYVSIYLARSTDENIRKMRYGSGGAITSILIYAVEKGLVDAVIVARRKFGLEGEIVVARSKEDIINVAGNRWSVIPYTAKMRETLEDDSIKHVAVLGLPCQAQFLRQMKLYPLLEMDFSKKIKYIISLFCMGTYATEAFLAFLKKTKGLDPADILDIELRGDKIRIKMVDQDKMIPLSDILPYVQLGCLICPDYTGIFSDISAGISENYLGYTVLISRTPEAEQLIKNAQKENYIEILPSRPDLVDEIKFRAETKLLRSIKYASILL